MDLVYISTGSMLWKNISIAVGRVVDFMPVSREDVLRPLRAHVAKSGLAWNLGFSESTKVPLLTGRLFP